MKSVLIRHPELENPALLHQGRLPSRSEWFAYTNQASALAFNSAASPWQQTLDGDWKFHLADCPSHIPAGFESDGFDDLGWSATPVPSHWHCQGYDTPRYTNTRYPFSLDPPYVPEDNPTGCYRRWFTVPASWDGRRTLLRFDGVDSAFHVWVNGVKIGFSKGSRLAAEFDITDALQPGDNLIAVSVYRWSDGCYLEAQDMWLLSGIFRSVSLRSEAAVSLWDAELKTKLSDGYTKAELVIELTLKNSAAGSADVALEAQLLDVSGLSVFSVPVTASAQV